MFQQMIDWVDTGAGQVITLVMGLGSCRVGLSGSYHQGELSSIVPVNSPLVTMIKGQGQFYCFFILSLLSHTPPIRASSMVFSRYCTWATFPNAAAGEG